MTSAVVDTLADVMIAREMEAYREGGFDGMVGIASDFGKHTATSPKVKATTDAQAIIVHKLTGEQRPIPRTYLAQTMKQRYRDGGRVFEAMYQDEQTGEWRVTGPVAAWKTGTYMCFLHPEHPDRELLEEIGIGREIVCGDHETAPAAHIASALDLKEHERLVHPVSWGIRAEAQERREREDEREERRHDREAMLMMAQATRDAARARETNPVPGTPKKGAANGDAGD